MWFLHLQHCCPTYMGDSKEGFCCHDVSSCNHCHLDWLFLLDEVGSDCLSNSLLCPELKHHLTSTGEAVLINCEVISRFPSFSLPNGIKGKIAVIGVELTLFYNLFFPWACPSCNATSSRWWRLLHGIENIVLSLSSYKKRQSASIFITYDMYLLDPSKKEPCSLGYISLIWISWTI